MKILGYCLRCHKVKQVYVAVPNLYGVSIGTCDDCTARA